MGKHELLDQLVKLHLETNKRKKIIINIYKPN